MSCVWISFLEDVLSDIKVLFLSEMLESLKNTTPGRSLIPGRKTASSMLNDLASAFAFETIVAPDKERKKTKISGKICTGRKPLRWIKKFSS